MTRSLAAVLVLLLPLVAAGCAYRLADDGGPAIAVAVATLANDSSVPGAELVLAAALRRELERTGDLRPVDSPTASGYRIGGRVVAVDSFGRTFTPGVRVLEYTLQVQLALEVTGPDGRRLAIDPFAQRASEIYLASTDVQISRKNRDEALRRVAAILAARIRRELERMDSPGPGAAGRRPGVGWSG